MLELRRRRSLVGATHLQLVVTACSIDSSSGAVSRSKAVACSHAVMTRTRAAATT
jgi:hypothetical protein